ncbi:hypothetical protein ACVIST_004995 [Bradyrhizobium elkanii]
MLGSAISDRVCAVARRFSRANNGNVAVIFTFAMLPLLAFVGAAIDYTRANNARSAMQAALDSTALMLSKDLTMGNITAAEIPSKAQTYFTALYTNKDGQGISVTANYTTPTSSAAANILLGGSGYIKSDFMQLAGFPTLGFKSSTTTTWGNVKMRVALALDNTGSMAQDGKITALRNAVAGTGGLIDQLSALSKNNGDVYISVIPFAKVVNVGTSNVGQSWIDWTDWLNPPTTQPANGTMQASLPMNWHAVGPGARCPLDQQQWRLHLHEEPDQHVQHELHPLERELFRLHLPQRRCELAHALQWLLGEHRGRHRRVLQRLKLVCMSDGLHGQRGVRLQL